MRHIINHKFHTMSGPILKVAVTQAEPEWLDLAEAANNGSELVAFPECWIPGYPGWIWERPVDTITHTQYIQNSLAIDSPEMRTIQASAKSSSVAVSLGFSERTDTHSLYISQVIITPQGHIGMHRRKIKPTHMERTIFGDGSGDDLNNVIDIDFGGDIGVVKVGSLACWEHSQPLLKYHTYAQKEAIHISAWPPTDPHGGVEAPGLWSMSAEGTQCLSQAYAIEGGTFVLHCTAVCNQKGIDKLKTKGGLLFREPGGGNSVVFGPDGRRLTKPLADGNPEAEGIVYAELNLTEIVTNRVFLDVVGHYSRPDLLWLGVDKKQKQFVVPRRKEDEDA
ncbi:Arylacetonitrilase [Fusarium kuroshium]|uniref:nitrilase n=1 Tax=Fusarium kuroshium TaxID=2010991 RepID=A0A3M2SFW3_9HYPO|nr:Arylacetonitrilase [Fusarium kuroshium]